jgi:hypothetical protein
VCCVRVEKGIKNQGFHVFVLADDIFENFGLDLGVVPFLLQRYAVHLPCLHAAGNIVRIDLRRNVNAAYLGMITLWCTCNTQYFPPFFFPKISSASGEYPGAMTPSDTSREMMRAVARSQGVESAMKSP